MIYQLGDLHPQIHQNCFIAKSADIIGDVVLQEGVYNSKITMLLLMNYKHKIL
jgi:carbonic anhydrase/acetyltransferase-like protein (isoleucine patch superfamily)